MIMFFKNSLLLDLGLSIARRHTHTRVRERTWTVK